jgi:hypothetical protein
MCCRPDSRPQLLILAKKRGEEKKGREGKIPRWADGTCWWFGARKCTRLVEKINCVSPAIKLFLKELVRDNFLVPKPGKSVLT